MPAAAWAPRWERGGAGRPGGGEVGACRCLHSARVCIHVRAPLRAAGERAGAGVCRCAGGGEFLYSEAH